MVIFGQNCIGKMAEITACLTSIFSAGIFQSVATVQYIVNLFKGSTGMVFTESLKDVNLIIFMEILGP